MKIRIGRTSIAWLAMSAIMYVTAIILTMTITSAEGGVLAHGERGIPGARIMHLTMLVECPAPPPEEAIWVRFVETSRGARLLVEFINGVNPILVTDELRDAHACDNSALTASEQPLAEEIVGDVLTATWRKVTPAPYSGFLSCWLRPGLSRPETFITRSVEFVSYIPRREIAITKGEVDAIARGVPSKDVALRGLSPAPYKFDLEWAAGARDIKFRSLDPAALEGETWRVIMPGELVTAAWTDIYRQQMRDILLIVIGTLIGVGVTVMIEGLRPLIENLGVNPKEKTPDEPPPAESVRKK